MTASFISAGSHREQSTRNPLLLVLAISIVIGLLMVIVFRYTSDQKAIGRAKDRLKAHLLAVRLFQDQLPVVMRAYGKILRGTGSYLRLAFTPFLIAILPITFLIVQLDRYFGWMPLRPAQTFLVEARVEDPAASPTKSNCNCRRNCPAQPRQFTFRKTRKLYGVSWRERDGTIRNQIAAAGQTASKQVVVSPGLARISPVRLRGNFWERMFASGEPALAENSPVQSIAINLSASRHQFRVDGVELDRAVLCGLADCRFHFQERVRNSGMKLLSFVKKRLGIAVVALIIALVLLSPTRS